MMRHSTVAPCFVSRYRRYFMRQDIAIEWFVHAEVPDQVSPMTVHGSYRRITDEASSLRHARGLEL